MTVNMHTHTHACTCTPMHAHAHPCMHTHTHACTRTPMHAHVHPCHRRIPEVEDTSLLSTATSLLPDIKRLGQRQVCMCICAICIWA